MTFNLNQLNLFAHISKIQDFFLKINIFEFLFIKTLFQHELYSQYLIDLNTVNYLIFHSIISLSSLFFIILISEMELNTLLKDCLLNVSL
jgi:hypothetical protein